MEKDMDMEEMARELGIDPEVLAAEMEEAAREEGAWREEIAAEARERGLTVTVEREAGE